MLVFWLVTVCLPKADDSFSVFILTIQKPQPSSIHAPLTPSGTAIATKLFFFQGKFIIISNLLALLYL